MKCPVCKDKDLVMSERSGIEIDYCPECRGVWLDRGELDKIIERNMASQQETYREAAPQKEYREERHYENKKYYDDDYKYHDKHSHYGKHKKRSFLSDIFDFD
ncbi:MAG: zf-TFIIB domain-containing protein [Mucispirillum sp.]|nr:zf-TFIIB domain-containing protein [Mucispirillum sp.]